MRQFKQVLNASVSTAVWIATIKKLRKRLEHGTNIVSGLAQPPRSETSAQAKRNEAYTAKLEQELRDIRADLSAALGGAEAEIVITQRSADYKAQLRGSAAWGCGKEPAAAIGDLVLSHPELFGVKIK